MKSEEAHEWARYARDMQNEAYPVQAISRASVKQEVIDPFKDELQTVKEENLRTGCKRMNL